MGKKRIQIGETWIELATSYRVVVEDIELTRKKGITTKYIALIGARGYRFRLDKDYFLEYYDFIEPNAVDSIEKDFSKMRKIF